MGYIISILRPTMSSTTRAATTSSRGVVEITLPSRSTVMRSAMLNTSSSLWEM